MLSPGIKSITLIKPEEFSRKPTTFPASLLNRCRILSLKLGSPHLFIPIRSMQFQSVVDGNEIHFIDSNGGYGMKDGEAGRLLELSWEFSAPHQRDSLSQPIDMCIVAYRADYEEIHTRLMSEFPSAIAELEKKQNPPTQHCEIRVLRR